MRRIAAIVLALLLAGCAGTADRTGPTSFVTPESAARMGAAEGLAAKRAVAEAACAAAGLDREAPGFTRCITQHFAVEAARLRSLAQFYSERLARRHSLCLDQARHTVYRCVEI